MFSQSCPAPPFARKHRLAVHGAAESGWHRAGERRGRRMQGRWARGHAHLCTTKPTWKRTMTMSAMPRESPPPQTPPSLFVAWRLAARARQQWPPQPTRPGHRRDSRPPPNVQPLASQPPLLCCRETGPSALTYSPLKCPSCSSGPQAPPNTCPPPDALRQEANASPIATFIGARARRWPPAPPPFNPLVWL
jgi:hypothetical protein